ncbi:DUF2500 family protein [Streptomyces sp. NRRL S-813]|uniref:DUF2500 family protein n=1 Tax=Streptomyces sp. NRRL S-813 TaxID=1463919 RepID=UPI0004C0E601|nr:DUF2500 family protein [Streptomyces sp. NRRL S-813]
MRIRLALAVTAVAALALTGCSDQHKPGPAGKVIAKDTDRECKSKGTGKKKKRSCHTEYELTVRTSKGDEVEVDVSGSDYNSCSEGASYPRCAKQ